MIATVKIIAMGILAVSALYLVVQNFIEAHEDKRKLTENIISSSLIVLTGIIVLCKIFQA